MSTKEIIRERLKVIEEFLGDDVLVDLSPILDSRAFTAVWKPQYGDRYVMFACLSREGVLSYANTLEMALKDDTRWFEIAADLGKASGWTKELEDAVRYGKELEKKEGKDR